MSDMVPPQDWTPQEPERSPDFTSPQAASPAAAEHPHPDAGWEVVDLPGTISLAELEQQALAAFEKLGFVASSPVSDHPQPSSDSPTSVTSEATAIQPSAPSSIVESSPPASSRAAGSAGLSTPPALSTRGRSRTQSSPSPLHASTPGHLPQPQGGHPPKPQTPKPQAPKPQAPKRQPDQQLMQVMQAEINQNPLLQALQAQNQDLQRRVTQLEEVLNDCRDTLQLQMMRSQTQETLLTQQTDELASARSQLSDLLGELATSQEAVEKQKILIETLTQQLEGSQERVAHLERVCALAQQRHIEQVNHIQQSEQTCRELRSRLHRQQRQTLQFRTALEQCLELSRHGYPHTGAHSPSHPTPPSLGLVTRPNDQGENSANHPHETSSVNPEQVGSEALGGARRSAIQPWSAQPWSAQDAPQNLLDSQDEAALAAPIMPKRGTQLPADLRPSELAALAAWELEADQPMPEAIASTQAYGLQAYSAQEYSAQEYSAQEYSAQDYGPEFDEDAMLPAHFAPSDWTDTTWVESAERAIAELGAIAPVATSPVNPLDLQPADATILEATAAHLINPNPITTDTPNPITTDTSPNPITAGDITASDTTASDTTVGDTTVGDTTVGDITASDTTASDTTVGDTSADQPHPSLAKVLEMGAALLRQSQDRRPSASVIAFESLDERAHADAVAFAALDLPEALGSDDLSFDGLGSDTPNTHTPNTHTTYADVSSTSEIVQGAIAETLNLPQFERSVSPNGAKVISLSAVHPPELSAQGNIGRYATPPLLQAKSPSSKRRTTLAAVELPHFNRRSS